MVAKVFSILMESTTGYDHTVDVFTSADGSAGAKVSIHKSLAWSALTFDSSQVDSRTTGVRQINYGAAYATTKTALDELNVAVGNTVSNVSAASLANEQVMGERTQLTFTLAANSLDETINLHNVSVGVFLTAMENVAALRTQNGAAMSRLEFQQINLSRQRNNMEAANGRMGC